MARQATAKQPPERKPRPGLTALADQLGYLDRFNMGTILDALVGTSAASTPPGTATAIRFALAMAAKIIMEGRLGSERPPGF